MEDLDARLTDGSTAVLLASENGNSAGLRFLIERDVDLGAVDHRGNTAAIRAVEGNGAPGGRLACLRILTEQGLMGASELLAARGSDLEEQAVAAAIRREREQQLAVRRQREQAAKKHQTAR